LAPKETKNNLIYRPDIFDRRFLLWSLSFFIIIILTISAVSFYVMAEPELYYPFRLTSALDLIEALNPGEFSSTQLIKQARKEIFDQLDRYSGYVDPHELDRVEEEFSGSYGGIGVTITGHENGLSVISVREDGPAGRAGIKTGDLIIKVDDRSIADVGNSKAAYLLRGNEGTRVNITVVRNDFIDTVQFELTRENLKLIHIPYAGLTDNDFLYIRILDFEAGLSEQMNSILDTLYENHRPEIKGIILDVRGNPGGLLHEAVAVCDMFLDKGKLIVGVKGRSRWRKREYFSTGKDCFDHLPLAILTDRGSASAAEILSGALKFSGRAFLVGDTTYGKGLVQEYDFLTDGSGIRLTTARYYFAGNIFLSNPDSTNIDSAFGIAPDYYLKAPEYEPFPMALESSQLMRDFAVQHQDEILAVAPFALPPPEWFQQFINYADSEHFSFVSRLTSVAELIRDDVVYHNHSEAAFKAIDKICQLAVDDDRGQYEVYRDYIKQRLYQLATESKYGRARAYRDAIVPYRPEVFLAEKIINDEATD
jgi:carboxyl-terminal processing protease